MGSLLPVVQTTGANGSNQSRTMGEVKSPLCRIKSTVDKNAAHHVGSDIDALAAPYRGQAGTDETSLVTAYAAEHGLLPSGTARFRGHGQGRIPRRLARYVRDGEIYAAGGTALAERIEALPDPDAPRPDPEFTLRAFRKAV